MDFLTVLNILCKYSSLLIILLLFLGISRMFFLLMSVLKGYIINAENLRIKSCHSFFKMAATVCVRDSLDRGDIE